MHKWIATLGAAALALSLTVPAAAEPEKSAADKPAAKTAAKGPRKNAAAKGRMQAVLAKLNLTADQKTKIQSITTETRTKGKAIREGSGTPEEKKTKMRELQKGRMERINAVLTEEQKTQLQAEMKKLATGKKARAAKGKKAAAKKPAGAS